MRPADAGLVMGFLKPELAAELAKVRAHGVAFKFVRPSPYLWQTISSVLPVPRIDW